MSLHRRAVLAGLGLWLVAALLGWATFRALGGTDARGLTRWSLWGAALAVILLGGLILMRAARGVVRADRRAEASIAAGIGWGVASAAGWFFDVSVGGPLTGMTLAVITDVSRRDQRPWARVALMLGAGLVGLSAGVRLLGGRGSLLALASALIVGLPVLLLANRVLTVAAPWPRLVWFTLLWGAAWVGSWALTSSASVARPLGSTTLPVEVILACFFGGLFTAMVLRKSAPRALTEGAIWAAAAIGAVMLGTLADRALQAAGYHPGAGGTWLDVGYTLGLALFIPFAFDHTINRAPTASA